MSVKRAIKMGICYPRNAFLCWKITQVNLNSVLENVSWVNFHRDAKMLNPHGKAPCVTLYASFHFGKMLIPHLAENSGKKDIF